MATSEQPQFHLRLKPVPLLCPICNKNVVTRTEHRFSWETHTCAILLCVFGLWCFVCLPYIFCAKVQHFCPYCHAFLGEYQD